MTTSTLIASTVFMVRPTHFGYNEQTAVTNTFQVDLPLSDAEVAARAVKEFDAMVATLRRHGITVITYTDQSALPKPDAVFPNNWFTTRSDGQVFTYPMATENRRWERTSGALDELRARYSITKLTDLSAPETDGVFLEGTGAIVMDHIHKIAYGAISPRCDEALFKQHSTNDWGYRPVAFRTAAADGTPIYHTNVLMGVQQRTAVLCTDAIPDTRERQMVVATLEQSGHNVIAISFEQLARFCGNVLQVRNQAGINHLILSQTAYDAFTPEQRTVLAQDNVLVPVAIPTIEAVGGGSARCMLAEIFLPARAQ